METTLIKKERVVENLNRALHNLFETDPHVFLLGEDILDPYGGAFKVSRGLSSAYGDRILSTPISEEGIVGVAGGLALCGEKPIVEIMFGDFIALSFDQILNFAAKSVSMYGQRLDFNLVVRCAIGGNRGYGPTHSQSLQKHFIGIPNLHLFEVSPFHNNLELMQKLTNLGCPAILFEDKVLYTQRMYEDGEIDELFQFDYVDDAENFARISSEAFDSAQCLIITTGGVVNRCIQAARDLFIEDEIETEIVVPAQLYPFDVAAIADLVAAAEHILIVEDGVAGGTWGSEVAQQIYSRFWSQLKSPITLVHSQDSIIPSSAHLERQVLVQADTIYDAVQEMLSNA